MNEWNSGPDAGTPEDPAMEQHDRAIDLALFGGAEAAATKDAGVSDHAQEIAELKEAYELDVAALHLEFVEDRMGPVESLGIPPAVLERLRANNATNPKPAAFSSGQTLDSPSQPSGRANSGVLALVGWSLAAIFLVGWVTTLFVKSPEMQTPAEAMAKFEQEVLDRLKLSWDEGPDGQGVGGQVIWSPTLQRGYLVFSNLPDVESAGETYQLWIFDEERKHPVDGGVFQSSVVDGKTIVAIRPAIVPRTPTGFAVTREREGGVVVSEKEHVITVAMLDK